MRTLKDQGSLFASQGRSAEAAERHREAGRMLESIATAVDEATLRAERCFTSVELADALFQGGDRPLALEEFKRTLAQVDGWRQQAPNDPKLLHWTGVLTQRIADALTMDERWPEALVYIQKSIDVDERLVAQDVHNATAQSELGMDYERLALAYSQMKDEKAALREIDRAVTLFERLSADDRANAHLSILLAEARGLRARSLGYLGRDSEAVAAFGQSIPVYRARVAQDATNAYIPDQLAERLTAQGDFFAARRRFAEARRALGDARELRETLAREHPEYDASRSQIPALCRSLAKVELDEALALRGAERCAGLRRARESLACAVAAVRELPAGKGAPAAGVQSLPNDFESERARIEGLLATSRCGG
jgi:tetratricopeptide (TPR) repeat protein